MGLAQLKSQLAYEEQKLLACIHCGLCLEACPTYVITGDENDGPRGRLYLMRAVGENRLTNDAVAFERHIDRCLGCRACEQVCPAGVEYGQLLEAARAELFVSATQRGARYALLRFVLKHIWLHPYRIRIFFTLARLFRDSGAGRLFIKSGIAGLLSPRLSFALALLESSRDNFKFYNGGRSQVQRNNAGPTGIAASLFKGCVGQGLFARVNEATQRVLQVNGIQADEPQGQVCCGALHAHAGDLEGARQLARRNIEAFAASETPIVTNAGGCGAMLLSYEHLLGGDETFASAARKFSKRVRDVSQMLKPVGQKFGTPVTSESVTYDASCHLLYAQHAGEAPLELLAAVPKLNFVRLEGSERCCGGAGIYNLLEPDLSRQVLTEKLANIQTTGATVLATGNPGCQMQIGAGALLAGMNLRTCHPIELLDALYERNGCYGETHKH